MTKTKTPREIIFSHAEEFFVNAQIGIAVVKLNGALKQFNPFFLKLFGYNKKELSQIFKYFGEEKESKRIAHNIVEDRSKREITTEELVRIIESSKRKRNYKTHSATKIFQALRIFVNKEISELIYGLINAAKVVKKDGVIAVVTFHSLEDKIVKYFFKSLSENKSVSRHMPKIEEKLNLFKSVIKKPIVPGDKEISENPPSRSAKLRYVIKKEDFFDFETDILDKFKHLIDIENLSKKL